MENFNQSKSLNSTTHPPGMQLCMIVQADVLALFLRLLSQGFAVTVQPGCSIRDLLCLQLGIREEYLDERIQTIFLNGNAVDDVDSTIVENDATLALSGAMPGLAGATLRKGGILATMRNSISHKNVMTSAQQTGKTVIIKFFNLVTKDLGPPFIQQGVWLRAKQLHDFVASNLEILERGCKSAKLDGQDIKVNQILGIDVGDNLVNLKLKTDSKS